MNGAPEHIPIPCRYCKATITEGPRAVVEHFNSCPSRMRALEKMHADCERLGFHQIPEGKIEPRKGAA